MKKLNIFDRIAFILVIIGGLNWGAVGIFHLDLVGRIFGDMSMLSRVIFGLVGISAIYLVFFACRCKSKCGSGAAETK